MYMNGKRVPNSTTATRRAERQRTARWLHVSQWFTSEVVTDPDTGVTTIFNGIPQFRDSLGFPKGRTYLKVVFS